MRARIDAERFPEWQPFVDAVQQRRPDAGTWCEAWTVHATSSSTRPVTLRSSPEWVAGADDVVVSADTDSITIGLVDPDGPATLETDAAARVLLLWGRRPADPSRICSRVGPQSLGRVRALLAGY
jgi:hypothetical protein